jgi:tetratricopeptide (TPR) repeat protein
MPMDAPEFDDYVAVVRRLPLTERSSPVNANRAEALQRVDETTEMFFSALTLGMQAGEFARARDLFLHFAKEAEEAGRIAGGAGTYAMVSRCHNALGDLDLAADAYQHSLALAGKLAGDPLLGAQSIPAQQVVAALDELRLARGTEVAESVALARGLGGQVPLEIQWARASLDAAVARIFAMSGHIEEAVTLLDNLSRCLDRIPAWDVNNVRLTCDAAHALWAMARTDHLDIIERNLREKVIAPDFRYPMFDGRMALARLCALSGRFDEASDWFAKARTVLDEQGARPLRAITDYDEALMYVRRNAPGDHARALHLLDAAMRQFNDIGMPGWIQRAEDLRSELS